MFKKISMNILLLGVFSIMLSCSSDDDGSSKNCLTETTKYVDAENAKSIKYLGNPTSQNCNEYKKAIQEALTRVENCANYPVKQTLVEGYKLKLNNLDCK